ncbi:MAG TPA: RING finger protein [Armatimonadota bacterium]|jgi:hypothetical protein
MRCPSCHQNIRIQGKFCPKCGEQIFGLPVATPGPSPAAPSFAPPPATPSGPPPPVYAPSPPPDLVDSQFDSPFPPVPPSEPVLDITLDDFAPGTSTSTEDNKRAIGKLCPYCRFPIKAGEAVRICPSCGEPHHLECWNENGGCTTYGCQSSPQMAAQAAVAQPTMTVPSVELPYRGPTFPGGLAREAQVLLIMELDRLATNALIYAILGFICFFPAIIGLFTAISVLGQIARSGLPASGAKLKAWIAIAVSLLYLVPLVIGLAWSLSGGGPSPVQ